MKVMFSRSESGLQSVDKISYPAEAMQLVAKGRNVGQDGWPEPLDVRCELLTGQLVLKVLDEADSDLEELVTENDGDGGKRAEDQQIVLSGLTEVRPLGVEGSDDGES